jgi:hypothetical protein
MMPSWFRAESFCVRPPPQFLGPLEKTPAIPIALTPTTWALHLDPVAPRSPTDMQSRLRTDASSPMRLAAVRGIALTEFGVAKKP